MKPQTIGRVLGIGVRVAGRAVGQRIMGPQEPGTAAPFSQAASADRRTAGQRTAQAGQTGGSLRAGIGGFLRPFRRAGGIIWLEVTGVFFFLPVLVFGPSLWREGLAYPHTADHRIFWLTAGVVILFLYLGVSSFWRARRR